MCRPFTELHTVQYRSTTKTLWQPLKNEWARPPRRTANIINWVKRVFSHCYFETCLKDHLLLHFVMLSRSLSLSLSYYFFLQLNQNKILNLNFPELEVQGCRKSRFFQIHSLEVFHLLLVVFLQFFSLYLIFFSSPSHRFIFLPSLHPHPSVFLTPTHSRGVNQPRGQVDICQPGGDPGRNVITDSLHRNPGTGNGNWEKPSSPRITSLPHPSPPSWSPAVDWSGGFWSLSFSIIFEGIVYPIIMFKDQRCQIFWFDTVLIFYRYRYFVWFIFVMTNYNT